MGTLIRSSWGERASDDGEDDTRNSKANEGKDYGVLFLGEHPVNIMLTADGSLRCTNFAIDDIVSLCPFHGMILFLHRTHGLLAGQIDTTGQQITVESMPLGKSPRRVVPMAGWLCCLNENNSQSFLTLLDPLTMKPHDEYAFPNNEMAASLTTIVLGDDNVTYCAVGTGVEQKVAALEGKEESKYPQGHIYLFRLIDNKFYLARCLNVNGVVYSLHSCEAGLLAGVDARVILYKTAELKQCCEYFGHVVTLTIDSIGNRVLTGDLVRSLTLLEYQSDGFHELAKDYSQLWIVQAMMINESNFLVSDAFGNLIFFTLRDFTGPTGLKDLRIERCGECNVGSMVNVLRRGSLTMKLPEQQKSYTYRSVIKEKETKETFTLSETFDTVLFGTVSGILGSIAILKQDVYRFLLNLQNYIPKEKFSLGNFDFTSYFFFFCFFFLRFLFLFSLFLFLPFSFFLSFFFFLSSLSSSKLYIFN